jgi:hypothetical protein
LTFLKHMAEYLGCSLHVLTPHTAIDQRIVRDDIGLHICSTINHDLINLHSLFKLVCLRIGLYHGGEDDCVSLNSHPTSILNLVEGLLGSIDEAVVDTGVDQTTKNDIII